MKTESKTFDCAIVGGGLAGLCLAIQLAENGISVVLFEKNIYPFHKVCGEYISMESWDFLIGLGLPLDELNLPIITDLGISSEKGFMLNHRLEMGGFGISRYSLDDYLSKIAVSKGVLIVDNCKVNRVKADTPESYSIETSGDTFNARIVCGSYGKYTPAFIENKEETKKGINYIGVKYHIKTALASNRIELHNFKDGYCGVSKVDQDWHCLCYLTTSQNLQENGKDIKAMEKRVLYKNPFLEKYFTESHFINEKPLVISNVQFHKKEAYSDGLFLLGDAAGSITPLCGNGMSMGMRASMLLATELIAYFANKQSKEQVAENYRLAWDRAFHQRITAGYYLQYLFGKKNTTDFVLKLLDKLPSVTNKLVSLTHGKRF